ncbi:MAG: DUF488 domain-containing protein [Deltaproteobacteria bacterium]|nr:DUF488 domain-containing protein [Deltaproteobacteria bacterium]MBW2123496.1 DUF488 domain-containing protein [Deltaproteobacteria bacterium]
MGRPLNHEPDLSRPIYTLGTSNREFQEFIEILDCYGIVSVVDVRRFPTSRFEHFRRENLEKALAAEGFDYLYLGGYLGGYRKGGYEAYMESPDFSRGLEILLSVAGKGATAVICAEKLPWKCHRRFIGAALENIGRRVVHLIEKGRAWAGTGRTGNGR